MSIVKLMSNSGLEKFTSSAFSESSEMLVGKMFPMLGYCVL